MCHFMGGNSNQDCKGKRRGVLQFTISFFFFNDKCITCLLITWLITLSWHLQHFQNSHRKQVCLLKLFALSSNFCLFFFFSHSSGTWLLIIIFLVINLKSCWRAVLVLNFYLLPLNVPILGFFLLYTQIITFLSVRYICYSLDLFCFTQYLNLSCICFI